MLLLEHLGTVLVDGGCRDRCAEPGSSASMSMPLDDVVWRWQLSEQKKERWKRSKKKNPAVVCCGVCLDKLNRPDDVGAEVGRLLAAAAAAWLSGCACVRLCW